MPAGTSAFRPLASAPAGALHPAARLAAAALAVVSGLVLPLPGLALLLVTEAALLARAGLRWSRVPERLRGWGWLAALVLAVHTLTTLDAAPLGHPSWTGLGRGAVALARLAIMMLAVVWLRRALPLADLVAALGLWLRPLRCDPTQMALVLTVALGTVPRVIDEGRRVDAALRLRRAPGGGRWRRWRTRLHDRARALAPILESLARRAESLPLALHGRLPVEPVGAARPLPWPQMIGLLGWAAGLVLVVAW